MKLHQIRKDGSRDGFRHYFTARTLLNVIGILLLTVRGDPVQLFTDCVNKDFKVIPASWSDILVDFAPVRVFIEKTWSHDQPPRIPITVVTQLSSNRLHQLEAQCATWGGPLSAALYLPLEQEAPANTDNGLTHKNQLRVQKARTNLDEAFQRSVVNPQGCQLSLILLWEVVADEDVASLYPYNVGRNYALLQARTDLVALIDVDLMLCNTLAKELKAKNTSDAFLAEFQKPVALVLPAFEPTHSSLRIGRKVTVLTSNCEKKLMKVLWDQYVLRQFNNFHFPQGHAATDYQRWFHSNESYSIEFTPKYEPWVMMNRTLVPWYDVRLRGYAGDKLLHLMHVNASGIPFKVYHNAWIVHRPHGPSAGKRLYLQNVTSMIRHGVHHDAVLLPQANHRIFQNASRDLASGQFEPVVDPALLRCVRFLPWWRGFAPKARSH